MVVVVVLEVETGGVGWWVGKVLESGYKCCKIKSWQSRKGIGLRVGERENEECVLCGRVRKRDEGLQGKLSMLSCVAQGR